MWILFSPSEKKCLEHKKAQEKQGEPFYQDFICKESLEEALKAYQEFYKVRKNRKSSSFWCQASCFRGVSLRTKFNGVSFIACCFTLLWYCI